MLELNQIYHGDCLEVMQGFDDNSIDAIITDPPYNVLAAKWDRNWIRIEQELEYVEMANKRIKDTPIQRELEMAI